MAEKLRLYQLSAGTEGMILERCMIEAHNSDEARSMAYQIGLIHPDKGYNNLEVRYFGYVKHRNNPGVVQQPGEIWYHVIYADEKGEKHNDVYFIYHPNCNMRENPTAELARWMIRNGVSQRHCVIYDFYMEDHAGKRVEW